MSKPMANSMKSDSVRGVMSRLRLLPTLRELRRGREFGQKRARLFYKGLIINRTEAQEQVHVV